jgi:thiamine transport system permease protein
VADRLGSSCFESIANFLLMPQKLSLSHLPLLVVFVFLGLFYGYPLLRVLYQVTDVGVIHWGKIGQVLWFTTWQAGLSTILTILVGLPAAWIVGRFRFWGRDLLLAVSGIPFVLPTVVLGAALTALLGANGWFTHPIAQLASVLGFALPKQFTLIGSLAGILFAHVFYNVGILIRLVGEYWAKLDLQLEYAARRLGANRWQTAVTIGLPLLAPALLTAGLLVFIFDFTSFGVVLLIGGPQYATLEVAIFRQALGFGNLPMAALLSLLQLLLTGLLMALYSYLQRRWSFSLTSQRPHLRPPTFGWQWLAIVSVAIFTAVWVFLPLLVLAWKALTPMGGALSLQYFQALFQNSRNALFYTSPAQSVFFSLRNAFATVLLSLTLGLPLTWQMARNAKMARWLEPLLLVPLGTSAVSLGLGYLIAFGQPPLRWLGQPWLLPIVHSLVAFPFVVRTLLPAMRMLRVHLLQAAQLLGASSVQVFFTLVLPLVGRALGVAASFAFALSLGEFGATLLLTRPDTPTLPIAIYRLLSQPGTLNLGQSYALSVILMLFCMVSLLLTQHWQVSAEYIRDGKS